MYRRTVIFVMAIVVQFHGGVLFGDTVGKTYETWTLDELGDFRFPQSDWIASDVPLRRRIEGRRILIGGKRLEFESDGSQYLYTPSGTGWIPTQRTVRLLNPRGLKFPDTDYVHVWGVLHLLSAQEGEGGAVKALWSLDVDEVQAEVFAPQVSGRWPRLVLAITAVTLIFFAILAFVRAFRSEFSSKRVLVRGSRGLCLRCGYDLRGSGGRCPECGGGL